MRPKALHMILLFVFTYCTAPTPSYGEPRDVKKMSRVALFYVELVREFLIDYINE